MENQTKWYKNNFLLLPKISKETKPKFLFELYNRKTDGVIFLLTCLVIPFISLMIFRFIFGMGANGTGANVYTPSSDHAEQILQLLNFLVGFISAIAGFIYFFSKDSKLFLQSGLISIYLFVLLPNLVAIIPSLFVSSSDDYSKTMVSIWSQILTEIFIVVFALLKTINLKQRIITTFKENWKNLIVVAIIGLILMIAITTYLWGAIIKGTSLDNVSENQKQLTKYIHKIGYAISLFVLTILVAPMCEELIARNSFYTGVGNRQIAWIASAIFFGMLHCQSSGDLQNIPSYFIAGLILSTAFNFTGGNITYSWMIHMTSNAIAFGLAFQ